MCQTLSRHKKYSSEQNSNVSALLGVTLQFGGTKKYVISQAAISDRRTKTAA